MEASDNLKKTETASEKGLDEYFPRRFDFFGLGKVEANGFASPMSEIIKCPLVIAFRMKGDEPGVCAVGFDVIPQDPSMATEMANILVAKFANQLADQMNALVEITPPEVINNEPVVLRVLSNAPEALTRRYQFQSESEKLVIHLGFVPSIQGQA